MMNIYFNKVDQKPWNLLKMRRVQQYGYEFAYANRKVDSSSPIQSLPSLFQLIATRIEQANVMSFLFVLFLFFPSFFICLFYRLE